MPRLLVALALLIGAVVYFGNGSGMKSGFTAPSGAGGSGYTRMGTAGGSVGAGAVSSATRLGN